MYREALEAALVCMRIRQTSGLILLLALLLTPAVARGEEPEPDPPPAEDPGPDWFRDLADAAERGAIDPELAQQLESGEPVTALAVLDGTDVLEAYGDGGERGVAASAGAGRQAARAASRTRSTSRSCAPTASSRCCSCTCATRSRRSPS